ncbi:TPA: AIPR family protein, partial [Stenotrophomonas maltophilia]|nr:AIPR family protein [Stenotrophomonas maltophilia]HDX0905305.1 AIPR family protein [Stenotrophomonas maltophilia]
DATGFKQMIAKVIIFKQVQSLIRPLLPAFQGNVAIYLVSLLSQQHGSKIDLMRVWEQQGLSEGFKEQIRTWAKEVNAALQASAKGRMISEWAKKEECWLALQKLSLSSIGNSIIELR